MPIEQRPQDLTIKQGSTKRFRVLVKGGGVPIPWSGAETAALQMRHKVTDDEAVLSLTSASGGGLIFGPEDGVIHVYIDRVTTRNMTPRQSGVWDMDVTWPPGEGETEPDTRTVVDDGSYYVAPEVTR